MHSDADVVQTPTFQLYGALPAPIEAALRTSIKLHGVMMPVAVDQHGRILDGHHRKRLAEELGVGYITKTFKVRDDAHAVELARTLNEDRRQVPPEERRQQVADLRHEGHSERAIAGALGVSKTTVHKDLGQLVTSDQLTQPERVKGQDGRERPATNKPAKAKKEKPPKPKAVIASREVEKLYEQAKEEIVELKESLANLADLAASAKAFEEKAEFKEMQVLRIELRAVKRARDEFMNKCEQMEKMLAHYKRKLAKLEGSKK